MLRPGNFGPSYVRFTSTCLEAQLSLTSLNMKIEDSPTFKSFHPLAADGAACVQH